jgi:hypothetical protein
MNKRLLFTCLITGALALCGQLRAQDSSPLPTVQILATDPTALNDTSTASFTLIREGDTNENLMVFLDISGTASNGVDYLPITTAMFIPQGYLAVDIPIQPILNPDTTGNKTVVLTIATNADYQIARSGTAVVTIVDDIFNNPPPLVAITDPTSASSFTYPASITITATASDTGTGIQSVSIFADDEFLGRLTNAPYTVTWNNARPGRHTLFARAVDDFEQSSISSMVQITVSDILPTVSITSPANGQNFAANSSISITANPVDTNPGATITGVSFYENGRFLGVVTNAPYQFVWSNAPSGFYLLQAAVTDSEGLRGYAEGVKISVSRPQNASR